MHNLIITSPDIYDDSVNTLKSMGFDVKFSFNNTNVLPALAYHTDMQLVKIKDNKLISAPECFDYYSELLINSSADLLSGNTFLSCNYPADIAYNIIIGEKYAIHNFKYTDNVLKNAVDDKELISISQGYTACTVCALNDFAYITSDMGIYKSLNKMFDVLLIDDFDILLPGFDHGFFGGSSFMADSNVLAVNGDIKTHRNYESIKSFLLNYGINLMSLCKKPIMDIGSFVLI